MYLKSLIVDLIVILMLLFMIVVFVYVVGVCKKGMGGYLKEYI